MVTQANARVQFVQPEGFARPKGYSNGVVARGRVLFVAGQIGWDEHDKMVPGGFLPQFARALDNVLAVVKAAGGAAEDIVEMTIYVTDLDAYRQGARELGPIWKARLGRHFPAMALVGVAGLVEREAMVEIQARASLPEAEG